MKPKGHFHFCPRCGAKLEQPSDERLIRCDQCNFHFYFGPSVAAAAFISDGDGRVLFVRRADEPSKGKLAIPGGFVDIGETAEQALNREIQEEVGLSVRNIKFLGSHTNDYFFKEVTYPVLDFLFTAEGNSKDEAAALDGVESFSWLDPATVSLDDLAFPSIRFGVQEYLRQRDRG